MSMHRFRPQLNSLDARLTPSVTSAQFAEAAAQATTTQAALINLNTNIGERFPFDPNAYEFLAGYLPLLAEKSRESTAILTEYEATATGEAKVLAGNLKAVSIYNSIYADYFAPFFGGIPFGQRPVTITPVVPGAPSDDTPDTSPDDPNTDTGGTSPTPPTGLDTEMPDPNDPNFQPVGTDGLKVWDLFVGSGEPVQPGAEITVNYIGWVAATGVEFDSNVGDPPVQFDLDGLIQGWQQGIPGMRPGGFRYLYIPSELAYGASGSPPSIPPNADLIFEINLVSSP